MSTRFTQSFKIQSVEKALRRAEGTHLKEIADTLCIGYSTLQKWIVQSRNHEFDTVTDDKISSSSNMTKEKRPQDWSLEEKFNMVMTCASLDEEEISVRCREQGIYPHHIEQWKLDFARGNTVNNRGKVQPEVKNLKNEIKTLKKELNRKDKALAETAALLVLQKKVNAIWGNDEDNSQ